MKTILEYSGGPRSGREVGRLGVSSPIHGPGFLDLVMLAPRSWSNRACCLTNSSFMSANIWRSWASQVDDGWMSLVAPCEGVEIVSFAMGLKPLGEIMSPVVVADLPLEVVPSPMVGCFSGP